MKLTLVKENELQIVWEMQKIAFAEWEEKYQEGVNGLAKEPFEKTLNRAKNPNGKYYFITEHEERIGVIYVINGKGVIRNNLSKIWIMPKFRNKKYGQEAIKLVELLYPISGWEVVTALSEKRNIHFYKKLGYKLTNKQKVVNDRMIAVTLVK